MECKGVGVQGEVGKKSGCSHCPWLHPGHGHSIHKVYLVRKEFISLAELHSRSTLDNRLLNPKKVGFIKFFSADCDVLSGFVDLSFISCHVLSCCH